MNKICQKKQIIQLSLLLLLVVFFLYIMADQSRDQPTNISVSCRNRFWNGMAPQHHIHIYYLIMHNVVVYRKFRKPAAQSNMYIEQELVIIRIILRTIQFSY